MLHIFTLGTTKTLCGIRRELSTSTLDAMRAGTYHPDCPVCQIREDAKLMRGWPKKIYRVAYSPTRVHYAQLGKLMSYPQGKYHYFQTEFWQKEDLKAAIKMAKLGAEDFG